MLLIPDGVPCNSHVLPLSDKRDKEELEVNVPSLVNKEICIPGFSFQHVHQISCQGLTVLRAGAVITFGRNNLNFQC